MVDRHVEELYDSYSRNEINRRQFLEKLAIVAGGVAASYALLPLLENVAHAALIAADDARLVTEQVSFAGASGKINAYMSRPQDAGKLPGIVVIHENRGLNAHIEDVTRRIALEGYLALAPDALSSAGGTPDDQDKAIGMIKNLEMDTTIQDFAAAAKYLKTHPQSTGKVGVVGFCWGGAMANSLAVHSDDIIAAVPYYGMPPKTSDVDKIHASLLLHYAGQDERINKHIPEFLTALEKNNVDYEMYMYKGAKHAFNNDTNSERYNEEAAAVAWARTLAFLNKKLKD